MPTIHFYCPELDEEQKQEAIEGLTRVGSEVTGIDEDNFVVYLEERTPDMVGVGGQKLADMLAEQEEQD